jgi:hypothetical protein
MVDLDKHASRQHNTRAGYSVATVQLRVEGLNLPNPNIKIWHCRTVLPKKTNAV